MGGRRRMDRSHSLELLNALEQHLSIYASIDECYAAAVAFEDYPKWAGSMRRVRVLQRQHDGLGVLVEWVMGIFGVNSCNTMQYYHDKPHSVNWHTTTESKGIKYLHGRYDFKALSKGETRVTYTLNVEPNFPFPKVVKSATNKAVAKMALRDLKKYVEKIRRLRLRRESGVMDEEEGGLVGCMCVPIKAPWHCLHHLWKMGWWQWWTGACGCFA